MGLGLSEERLWSLTPRQYGALQTQWVRHQRATLDMLAVIRADIHNGWMPRKDQRAWTPQEFGATGERRDNVRRMLTPEEVRRKAVAIWGVDGKGHPKEAGAPGSALAALKGTGQPIPA